MKLELNVKDSVEFSRFEAVRNYSGRGTKFSDIFG